MINVWFRIAERLVQLSLPDGSEWRELLPSFIPFGCCCLAEETPMCSLQVVTKPMEGEDSSGTLLTEFAQVLGDRFRLLETTDAYVVELQWNEAGEWYRMISNKNFSSARVYVGKKGKLSGEALNLFLMTLFAQSAVLHRLFFIHASVVEKDEKGYAFLGKSGTGKSTHSALWMQHLEGVQLLNDDNPAIEIDKEGKIYIYGTPWSGKTPCYKNRKVELAACVRLNQSPVNRFLWRTASEALIALIPSCSSMRWNDRLFVALCDLLQQVAQCVPVGSLECRPDAEAAHLCYTEITEKLKKLK